MWPFFRVHPDILTDKDCEIVYELVYSSHRGVAQAAAEFLNVRLFHLEEDSMAVVKTKRGKKRLPNTPLIRDLVQFFIESELHEHGAYLVDSFIDNNPMVKDWECMTDLLIEEPGPNEEELDNKQESTLIEIMVSAVRQCSTGNQRSYVFKCPISIFSITIWDFAIVCQVNRQLDVEQAVKWYDFFTFVLLKLLLSDVNFCLLYDVDRLKRPKR